MDINTAIKEVNMIYQRSDKELVAEYLGVPMEVIDVEFEKWMNVRGAYLDRAIDWKRAINFNMIDDMPVRKKTRDVDQKFFKKFFKG